MWCRRNCLHNSTPVRQLSTAQGVLCWWCQSVISISVNRNYWQKQQPRSQKASSLDDCLWWVQNCIKSVQTAVPGKWSRLWVWEKSQGSGSKEGLDPSWDGALEPEQHKWPVRCQQWRQPNPAPVSTWQLVTVLRSKLEGTRWPLQLAATPWTATANNHQGPWDGAQKRISIPSGNIR